MTLWLFQRVGFDDGTSGYVANQDSLTYLHLGRLREHWATLKGVAGGELPDSALTPITRLPQLDEFFEKIKGVPK